MIHLLLTLPPASTPTLRMVLAFSLSALRLLRHLANTWCTAPGNAPGNAPDNDPTNSKPNTPGNAPNNVPDNAVFKAPANAPGNAHLAKTLSPMRVTGIPYSRAEMAVHLPGERVGINNLRVGNVYTTSYDNVASTRQITLQLLTCSLLSSSIPDLLQ